MQLDGLQCQPAYPFKIEGFANLNEITIPLGTYNAVFGVRAHPPRSQSDLFPP
jgi:hypothetical protein